MSFPSSRYIILSFLACLCTLSLIAKQPVPKEFKELRGYILSEAATTDINHAFILIDSLRLLATTKREQIKTDMTSAVLYYQLGDKVTALDIAIDVENEFRKNGDYSDQIGAIGFIASNFRELGLEDEALYYLNKAEPSINKLTNMHLKGQYGTLMQHESIGIYTNKQDYEKVNQSLHDAYDYVEFIEPGKQKDFFLATTIKFDAVNEYNLGNYLKAKELYKDALEVLDIKEDLLYGEVTLGLAKVALKEKEYNKSISHLMVVDSMVEASQYFQLKKELYKTYMKYYEVVGDSINYNHSHYLYLNTLNQDDGEVKQVANSSLRYLRSKIADNKSKSSSIFTLSMIAISVLIVVVILLYSRYKNQEKRFNYVNERLKRGDNLVNLSTEPIIQNNSTEKENAFAVIEESILEETETRILQCLTDMEADAIFALNAEVTLTKLASDMQTNTKYLAYVIRKHRGKVFNTAVFNP